MAELCPGIIFPTPYPQGYGATPCLPRARLRPPGAHVSAPGEPRGMRPREHARARSVWQWRLHRTGFARGRRRHPPGPSGTRGPRRTPGGRRQAAGGRRQAAGDTETGGGARGTAGQGPGSDRTAALLVGLPSAFRLPSSPHRATGPPGHRRDRAASRRIHAPPIGEPTPPIGERIRRLSRLNLSLSLSRKELPCPHPRPPAPSPRPSAGLPHAAAAGRRGRRLGAGRQPPHRTRRGFPAAAAERPDERTAPPVRTVRPAPPAPPGTAPGGPRRPPTAPRRATPRPKWFDGQLSAVSSSRSSLWRTARPSAAPRRSPPAWPP